MIWVEISFPALSEGTYDNCNRRFPDAPVP
jgi:hypothetical protein